MAIKSLALTIIVILSSFSLPEVHVKAADVQWKGNENISPEHKAAHEAPRSQKYWDENNIKRPDYAKTDAEIAADKRERGEGSGWGWTIVMLLLLVGSPAVIYGMMTGDWETITNNPAGAFAANIMTRMVEIAGIRGQKLGSSSSSSKSISGNDEEARRNARLARFDDQNQRNVLDSMKSE